MNRLPVRALLALFFSASLLPAAVQADDGDSWLQLDLKKPAPISIKENISVGFSEHIFGKFSIILIRPRKAIKTPRKTDSL